MADLRDSRDDDEEERGPTPKLMRWFFTRTAALPVKLLLLAWLVYAVVVAAVGALLKLTAAAKVTMAVLGVLATTIVFPILLALIVGAVVAYALPLAVVPRLWHAPRRTFVNLGLTVSVVLGSGLAGLILNKAAVSGIGWIADREPCAALRAGVTGSAPPSEQKCRSHQ